MKEQGLMAAHLNNDLTHLKRRATCSADRAIYMEKKAIDAQAEVCQQHSLALPGLTKSQAAQLRGECARHSATIEARDKKVSRLQDMIHSLMEEDRNAQTTVK